MSAGHVQRQHVVGLVADEVEGAALVGGVEFPELRHQAAAAAGLLATGAGAPSGASSEVRRPRPAPAGLLLATGRLPAARPASLS